MRIHPLAVATVLVLVPAVFLLATSLAVVPAALGGSLLCLWAGAAAGYANSGST